MTLDPQPPAKRRAVLLDSDDFTPARLSHAAGYSPIDIIAPVKDSTTAALLADSGIQVGETITDLDRTIGDAVRYAGRESIPVVLSDLPRQGEEWMRSLLSVAAEVAVAGQPLPLVHVLSTGEQPDGPVVLATETGELDGADVTAALDTAAALQRDVEVIVPANSEPDDTAEAERQAEAAGVEFVRSEADDPATAVVVRAASFSAIVLSVRKITGKLEAGAEIKQKVLNGDDVKTVLDAMQAAPPHDLIIYLDRAIVKGVPEPEHHSTLTGGAEQVP